MIKNSLLFVGVLLPVFVLGTWLFSGSDTSETDLSGITLPDTPSTSFAPIGVGQQQIVLQTGEQVAVADFISEATTYDNSSYSLQTSVSSQTQSAYSISFFEPDSFFALTLNEDPLVETRALAETELMAVTGLSAEQLCNLNISVRTTYDVNKFFAGQELGVSFCPGSVALE